MSDAPNPYEPPRQPTAADFREGSSVSELEQRVAELEQRLSNSWFFSNVFKRICAVWGYFLLGYALMAAIWLPIFLLLEFLKIIH